MSSKKALTGNKKYFQGRKRQNSILVPFLFLFLFSVLLEIETKRIVRHIKGSSMFNLDGSFHRFQVFSYKIFSLCQICIQMLRFHNPSLLHQTSFILSYCPHLLVPSKFGFICLSLAKNLAQILGFENKVRRFSLIQLCHRSICVVWRQNRS